MSRSGTRALSVGVSTSSGSDGALSIPDLRLWRHEGGRSWWHPIAATSLPRAASDPLVNQITHFADVIRGVARPLVSAEEGLRTMQVIEAIRDAADGQGIVHIADPAPPVPEARRASA